MMSEHTEQVKIFQWAAHRLGVYPELESMYAIPNANKRTKFQGQWLVDEGLKSGTPDICLPCARGGYHSLYVELKHGRNKTTDNQKKRIKMLNDQGNLAIVCYEFEGARDAIVEYLEMQPCGHPRSAIKGEGLTHWCSFCEEQNQG